MKARFRLAGVQLLNQYISTPFLQERKLKCVTVDERFHNFDKIPAKKVTSSSGGTIDFSCLKI